MASRKAQQGTDRRFWKKLLGYIANGRVIPIIGPEVLVMPGGNGGLLLHQYIAQRLAQELGVASSKVRAKETLNSVICRYLGKDRHHHKEDIYDPIDRILKEDQLREDQIPEPLLKLARIRQFKLFITTSFDPLLEMAVKKERPGEKVSVFAYSPHDPKDVPADLHQMEGTTIYYLLGKVAPSQSYAVTEEDTLEFLCSMQGDKRPARLFDELRERHLLVIGSSFPDWLARFFIRIAKGGRLSAERRVEEIIADKLALADKNLVVFLEHFSYRTEIFKEGGAVHFVDELWREYSACPPKEVFAATSLDRALDSDSSQANPEAFLSYAREDSAAAELIRTALEKIGWEVWFDKENLGAGDLYDQKITESIEKCSIFLPIISAHTQQTEAYLYREWNRAIDRTEAIAFGRAFICPVMIDDTPSSDVNLPKEFRKANWTKCLGGEPTEDFRKKMQQLLRERRKEMV